MCESIRSKERKTKQYLSRRQKLVLLGLVALNLLVFGGLQLLSAGTGSECRTCAAEAGEALELEQAYHEAFGLARSWQADVQVVGATTSWRLAGGDTLTLHRPAWSFSFYSPAAGRVQVVTVDHGGAQAGPLQSVGTGPLEVAPDWSLDSDELLLTFLGHGGEAFLGAHPGANIHLQLQAEEPGRSVWYITAIDPVSRQSMLVGVDARTRQVVLSKSSQGGA